ncbi:hypothetical protein VaNZ11_011449 [Volvox africanus]|uniref:Glutamine amidotransferase domain-containing protein n=1 Tax=Volvox africanus TaxID=51714 RepID=A0ABQ5SDL3_9CHLO|nr:hypothetical protein VaNZ11_011449 [Volvox africanus]
MKIAIFSCEDAEKWKGWTERLWSGPLKAGENTFTTFRQVGSFCNKFGSHRLITSRCYKGEFPDPTTCRDTYDAIVIGGSHYSAYDDLPWIRQLEQLLPQYINSGVRVVGCCFGHQILAKALGGTVGRNPSGQFVLGVEHVFVDTPAARRCGLVLQSPHLPPPPPLSSPPSQGVGGGASLRGHGDNNTEGDPPAAGSSGGSLASTGAGAAGAAPAAVVTDAKDGELDVGDGSDGGGSGLVPERLCLRVLQSHGDQVLTLPPGASLLATSGTAAHEMWALDNRCLAFQFHPELTPDLMYDKIWTALSASGRLSPEEAVVAEQQLKGGPEAVDSDTFLEALSGFLRGPPPEPRIQAPTAAAAGTSAEAAAEATQAAATSGVQVAGELRQELERRAAEAAEAVLGRMRAAAAAGMAAGTANAELLTALNQEAAAAYGRAATATEGASVHLAGIVADMHDPLKAALASLGALEAQLDRLDVVVGSLEAESRAMEEQVEAQARARTQQQ